MSTRSAKKQTKVLYATLILLLAATALLLMLTGNAERRDEADTTESETHKQETLKEDTGLFGNKDKETKPAETEKTGAETGAGSCMASCAYTDTVEVSPKPAAQKQKAQILKSLCPAGNFRRERMFRIVGVLSHEVKTGSPKNGSSAGDLNFPPETGSAVLQKIRSLFGRRRNAVRLDAVRFNAVRISVLRLFVIGKRGVSQEFECAEWDFFPFLDPLMLTDPLGVDLGWEIFQSVSRD